MSPEELKKIKEEALSQKIEPIERIYDAPIFASISQMKYMVNEEYNNQILRAVGQIGIEIDERGLVQALNQDRERYEQAYCVGYAACKKEYEARLLKIAKLTGVYLESEDEG